MKKLLLLLIITMLLNGCRYIHVKNEYLNAKEAQPLEIPAGLDTPSTTSELDVPKARSNNSLDISKKMPPPEMPIRTKQSLKGDVRIENVGGYPVLSVKTEEAYMWQALSDLEIPNWSTKAKNKENCMVTLHYTDVEAQERENAGFFKKLFTRDSMYSDYSGDSKLMCEKSGSLVTTKFSKIDGSKAKTFLADNVMNALFKEFD